MVTILPDAGIYRKRFCMLVNSYGLWMLENDEKHFFCDYAQKSAFFFVFFYIFYLALRKKV